MAILATIFGVLGRFVGRLLTAALGWASTLLFGRVPQDRQIYLLLMTFGSVVWVVLLIGVLFPEVGTFILAFVPIPDFIDQNWVRLAMLIAALVVPLLIGALTLLIQDAAHRPGGMAAVKAVLRGYPLTLVLAIVLVFLSVVAVIRKGRALVRRWKDAHVPVVVREGGYDQMVDDLERALDDAGLEVVRGEAPAVLAVPGRVLAAVAGTGVRSLVPERLVQLNGAGLEVQLHPSDVAMAGEEIKVNRARAAMASRLASSSAFMTTSAEAQALEERITGVADRERLDGPAERELQAIDERLASIEIPYEEWEVLYRQRLQIERDLRSGRTPGAVPGERPGAARAVPGEATSPTAPPIEFVVAGATVALLVADIVLALRERAGR